MSKTISDMISSTIDNKPLETKEVFSELMLGKIRDALEAKREEMASSVYNTSDDDEDDIDDSFNDEDEETVDDEDEDENEDEDYEDSK
jgi:hypothetical protein